MKENNEQAAFKQDLEPIHNEIFSNPTKNEDDFDRAFDKKQNFSDSCSFVFVRLSWWFIAMLILCIIFSISRGGF